MCADDRLRRKRLRVPLSCEICRKKKIRCDKNRPMCTSCVKSNSVCKYQEVKMSGSSQNYNSILNLGTITQRSTPSSFSRSLAARQETPYSIQTFSDVSEPPISSNTTPNYNNGPAKKTKIMLAAPQPLEQCHLTSDLYDTDDEINFYDGYSSLQVNESRVYNHGPLSWITLVKKDVLIRCLWTKVLTFNKSSLILNTAGKCADEDARDADDVVFNGPDTDDKDKLYGRKPNSSFTSYRPDTEQGTIQFILQILPEKRYIWALIDRFFENVYPLMPYLDYENFISRTVDIIGKRTTERTKVVSLGMKKRLDFALLGVLLLVLRFAQLSLQSNCGAQMKYAAPELQELIDAEISEEFANGAQLCLNQFRILRNSNLEILQCSLYMRIYHRYSPEEGDGPDADSQIYNGMLLQMAISIGLNREPRELLGPSSSVKVCQLRRKIWIAILQLQAYHNLVLGSPSYTKVQSSNIKSPVLNLKEYNSPNEEIEKVVNFWMKRFDERRTVLEHLNDLVLNLKGDTKISELLDCLDTLKSIGTNPINSMSDVLKVRSTTSTESAYKVKWMQSYLERSSTSLCVYFHIYLKYDAERNKQKTLIYMKKVMALSNNLVSEFIELVNKIPKYLGFGFDFYLTHSFLIAVHRALQAQFSLYTRLCHYECLLELKGESNIPPVIKSVKDDIMKTLAAYLRELKKLTPKYYYAWKMFKAQNLIYQVISLNKIFTVKDGTVGLAEKQNLVTDLPQYSILSELTPTEIQNLHSIKDLKLSLESNGVLKPHYNPQISNERSTVAASPSALSHILNTTPTTSSSSISLSPDNVHRDLMSSSTSKEVDDIWLNLLNRKKVEEMNGGYSYPIANENSAPQYLEQQRQLQQPDFSSLMQMNTTFAKPVSHQGNGVGLNGIKNLPTTFNEPKKLDNQGQINLQGQQQAFDPEQQPQPQVQQQQPQSQLQPNLLNYYDALNLNFLMDYPLNFDQYLNNNAESSFNNFL